MTSPKRVLGSPKTSLSFTKGTAGFAAAALGIPKTTLGFTKAIPGFNERALGFTGATLGFNKMALGVPKTVLGVSRPAPGFNKMTLGFTKAIPGFTKTILGDTFLAKLSKTRENRKGVNPEMTQPQAGGSTRNLPSSPPLWPASGYSNAAGWCRTCRRWSSR